MENETSLSDYDPMKDYMDDEKKIWEKLSPKEKAIAMNYKLKLQRGDSYEQLASSLASFNEVVKAHPELTVLCVP